MNKTIFIEDITAGATGVEEIFSVKEIQKHTAKNGDPYFRVVLQDKTGTIQGKIWKDAIALTKAETLAVGDVIKIDFEASEYNGNLQMTIRRAEKTTEYDAGDLMKVSEKDLEAMYAKLLEFLESLKDADIKRVVLTMAKDPELSKRLKTAIAGELVHHDYIGGLLEHTLEMMSIAETILRLYPRANRSIVMGGIFLHDLGKIEELGMDNTTFFRTLPGYLIGHITLGMQLLQRFIPPAFPQEKKLALEHIILSHHRELEFGAVVKPATLEAIIVSMCDLSSSVVRQFQKELDEGKSDESGFGGYHKYMKNRIYHKEIIEQETETEPVDS
ncbi:MAG: HD domain-containing protein [Candidatus Dojkabacteria bacterium]|nr:MAG: HD domain-containing protein [Candidatus Dojkabacteria bacterium]